MLFYNDSADTKTFLPATEIYLYIPSIHRKQADILRPRIKKSMPQSLIQLFQDGILIYTTMDSNSNISSRNSTRAASTTTIKDHDINRMATTPPLTMMITTTMNQTSIPLLTITSTEQPL